MDIKYEETKDDKKVFHIKGEINTNTAKELESTLDDKVSAADDIILDFAEVSYISSAGLRVLMKMQKLLAKLGTMTLQNVNSAVFEVFKMVRLDKIFNIEGASNTDIKEKTSEEYEIEESSLGENDAEKLPPRVYMLYTQDKLKKISIIKDDEQIGFVACETSKSGLTEYIQYIYVNEDERGKGIVATLVNMLKPYLKEKGIEEIVLSCIAELNGEELAVKLGFNKSEQVKHILRYTKKQIVDSPLWKQIDKLRGMFGQIKIFDELDLMEKMQLEQMLGDEDFEAIDPLYARIFAGDGTVTGLLNAQEVTENNIWITKVNVMPSKNANYAPVLMLGSLLDAVVTLLDDEDKIQVVNSKESMMKSFISVLGNPEATLQDTFYKIKL